MLEQAYCLLQLSVLSDEMLKFQHIVIVQYMRWISIFQNSYK